MIEKRPFENLGQFRNDWLHARHHFSFGGYMDRNRMGWGRLRVWNDDEIQPHQGFAPHPHRDMEIITYVREGAISHRDSLGTEGRTGAGDVQVMSAGRGIQHAEYNREDEMTRLYQIWILPDQEGGDPRWDAMEFPKGDRTGEFVTLASNDPEAHGGLMIRADARVAGATLKAGQSTEYALASGRYAYLGVAEGHVSVNGTTLGPRDAAAIKDEDVLRIEASEDAELVLVETN